MAIKKRYLKTKPVSKVTFNVPKEAAGSVKKVHIVGEFNNWNIKATPMKKLKTGGFSITLDLETGREYHFRYLYDQAIWENDWSADKYVSSEYGNCENSVVVV